MPGLGYRDGVDGASGTVGLGDPIDTQLFALHGTDDPNVPFDQMDDLVAELVERGEDFEMAYYLEEDHMFQRPATWRDALNRILPVLDEHLRE